MNHARFTLPLTKLFPLMVLICNALPIFVGPIFAETPPPVTINGVFDPDMADVKPAAMQAIKDAASKAKASQDGCYPPISATFTAQVKRVQFKSGAIDPVLETALGEARVDALRAALVSLGYAQGQAKTGYAIGSSDDVQVNYDKSGKDTDAPRLKVTSKPPKDTKVKAGEKIHVTIIASERYADGHKSWPTGVQSIQLIANDGLVDSKDYGKPPQPCARQTLEASYTVASKPPPIIHLHAIAEDGVGNRGGEDADFPTGETWKGTWHEDSNRSYRDNTTGAELMRCNDTWDGTLSFSVGADGTLEGTANAKVSSPFSCTPDQGRSSVERAREVVYAISGHKTATGFELHFKFYHNTPAGGVNWGGNMIICEGTQPCAGMNPQPPPVLLDRTTADNVASGRFTSQGSPLCGGSTRDVLALDSHFEVTRQ